jgi:hypothetical protein
VREAVIEDPVIDSAFKVLGRHCKVDGVGATGEIRSSFTDDIACWFIDTDYNEESFFVRHAYFTGAGQPFKKLQRALKAEIDEVAWASPYSTVSRPFDPSSTGKIAVKVIHHHGHEVLTVDSASPSLRNEARA